MPARESTLIEREKERERERQKEGERGTTKRDRRAERTFGFPLSSQKLSPRNS